MSKGVVLLPSCQLNAAFAVDDENVMNASIKTMIVVPDIFLDGRNRH